MEFARCERPLTWLFSHVFYQPYYLLADLTGNVPLYIPRSLIWKVNECGGLIGLRCTLMTPRSMIGTGAENVSRRQKKKKRNSRLNLNLFFFTVRNVVAERLCFHNRVSKILSGGSVSHWGRPPGQTPPPGRHTPLGRHPPNGHCSGRYASYWNAFLFSITPAEGLEWGAGTHDPLSVQFLSF